MDGWQGVYLLRERTTALLEGVIAGRVEPAEARRLLEDLRGSWTREKRWRNSAPRRPVRHLAGPVIDCREYRRSCPQFIVDRRQACSVCGVELVRGRWAMFFTTGSAVATLGTIVYQATGHELEIGCDQVQEEGAVCGVSA